MRGKQQRMKKEVKQRIDRSIEITITTGINFYFESQRNIYSACLKNCFEEILSHKN